MPSNAFEDKKGDVFDLAVDVFGDHDGKDEESNLYVFDVDLAEMTTYIILFRV